MDQNENDFLFSRIEVGAKSIEDQNDIRSKM